MVEDWSDFEFLIIRFGAISVLTIERYQFIKSDQLDHFPLEKN